MKISRLKILKITAVGIFALGIAFCLLSMAADEVVFLFVSEAFLLCASILSMVYGKLSTDGRQKKHIPEVYDMKILKIIAFSALGLAVALCVLLAVVGFASDNSGNYAPYLLVAIGILLILSFVLSEIYNTRRETAAIRALEEKEAKLKNEMHTPQVPSLYLAYKGKQKHLAQITDYLQKEDFLVTLFFQDGEDFIRSYMAEKTEEDSPYAYTLYATYSDLFLLKNKTLYLKQTFYDAIRSLPEFHDLLHNNAVVLM